MGLGGAEAALIEFMRKFDPERFDLDLYVIMGQGELIRRVPSHVRLLNRRYDDRDVLSAEGKKVLTKRTMLLMLRNGAALRDLPYLVRNIGSLRGEGRQHPQNLLWHVLADGCPKFKDHYDLAVAYLEGAATYYVADRVSADIKVAFIHTDYVRSGHSHALDRDAYDHMDRIYCVSEQTRDSFLSVYPEHAAKTEIFYNIIDRRTAEEKAENSCFFDTDGYGGLRIVSLGRLVRLKAVDKSINAMKMLKDSGCDVRWYVFGEGDARPYFQKLIDRNGLQDCFFLPGAVDNPFPFLRGASIYCQCSEYEGRSLAISEAQLMGCPVITSNKSGSFGQVTDNVDGVLVDPTPENIAAAISALLADSELRRRLGKAASERMRRECDHGDFNRILSFIGA